MSDCNQQVKRYRRYCLLARLQAARDEFFGISLVWRGKQEAEPGTPLSDDFPSKSVLEAAGYTALEDIDGASIEELLDLGLTDLQARAVLAATPEL